MKTQILTEFLTSLLRRPGRIAEPPDGDIGGRFADMVSKEEASSKERLTTPEKVSSQEQAPTPKDPVASLRKTNALQDAIPAGANAPGSSGMAANIASQVFATSVVAGNEGGRTSATSAGRERSPLMPAEMNGATPKVTGFGQASQFVGGFHERSLSTDDDARLLRPETPGENGGSATAELDADATCAAVPVAQLAVSLIRLGADTVSGPAREVSGMEHPPEGARTGEANADVSSFLISGGGDAKKIVLPLADHAGITSEGPAIDESSETAVKSKREDAVSIGTRHRLQDASADSQDRLRAFPFHVEASSLTKKRTVVEANMSRGVLGAEGAEAMIAGTGNNAGPDRESDAIDRIDDGDARTAAVDGDPKRMPRLEPLTHDDGEARSMENPPPAIRPDVADFRANVAEAGENERVELLSQVRQPRPRSGSEVAPAGPSEPASGAKDSVGDMDKGKGPDLATAKVARARMELARALRSFEEPVFLRASSGGAFPSTYDLAGQPDGATAREIAALPQLAHGSAPEVRKDANGTLFPSVPEIKGAQDDPDNIVQVKEPSATLSMSERLIGTASPAVFPYVPATLDGKELPEAEGASNVPDLSERAPLRHLPPQWAGRNSPDSDARFATSELSYVKAVSQPSSDREIGATSGGPHPTQVTVAEHDPKVSAVPGGVATVGAFPLAAAVGIVPGNTGLDEVGVSHGAGASHATHLLPGGPQAAAMAPDVSHQIARAVSDSGDRLIELTLSPEELGKVRLTLHGHDTAITVAVHAERSDTLDLLRRNIDLLARDFREIGYGDVSFSFGGHTGGGHTPDPDPPAPSTSIPEREVDAEPRFHPLSVSALSPAHGSSGGLDLRM